MNSDFDRVKSEINVPRWAEQNGMVLKREGSVYKTVCIFHDDHKPSLVLYSDGYKCFACGAVGSIIDLAMKLRNWSSQEALVELARYCGHTLAPLSPANKQTRDKRDRLFALMDHAAQFFRARLYDTDEALDYLCGTRGLSLETLDTARLGYAPDQWQRLCHNALSLGYSEEELLASGLCNRGDKTGQLYDRYRHRIMIPVHDHKGHIVSFTGRALGEGAPKYLHGKTIEGVFEKSKILHTVPSKTGTLRGENARGAVVVVEGSLDPISALNRGVEGVVSLLGKEMSGAQFDMLCKMGSQRLVFCLDNDETGHTALRRLVEKHMHTAAELGIALYAMSAPYGKDPDDTFRERPEMWQPAVDAARPVVDVLIEREMATLAKNAAVADKITIAKKLLPILKGSNGLVTHDNEHKLAEALGYPIDVITSWTQPQLSVIRPTRPAKQMTTQPTYEHWLIYYAVMGDEYVGAINQAFARISLDMDYRESETFFYGLGPADFQDAALKALMVMINQARAASADVREFVEASLETSDHTDAYERCLNVDQWSQITGVMPDISYEMCLRMALDTRIARLERESAAFKTIHRETWLRLRNAITLFQMAKEEIVFTV